LLGGVEGGLGSLFGGAEGGLAGLFGGAEGAGALGTEALGGIEPLAGLSAAPGGLAPAGAGAVDLASTAAAGGTEGLGGLGSFGSFGGEALGAAPGADISSATFIMPSGEVLPGPFEAGAGAAAGGGGTSGAAGLAGGTDLAGLVGGAPGGGAGAGAGAAAGVTDPLAAAGGGAGGGNFFGNFGSTALSSLTKNPLGIAAAGAGLGYNILKGQQQTDNQKALSGIAGQEMAQGQDLQKYLSSGTLPPGMQAQLDNAKKAAKAQIISGHAAKGLPTDPNANSALAQELAAVDTNSLELQGKLATNLLQAGINETNMSANLFQALIQMDTAQAKSMGQAIANFSTALAGGPKAIVLGGGGGAVA
jgi:hypothetical protein